MFVVQAGVNRRVPWTLLCTLLAVLRGCYALPVALDDEWPCTSDSDCVDDYTCREEVCVPRASLECHTNDECRPSERCDPSTQTCILRDDACASNEACAPWVCDTYAGECVACLSSGDCDSGWTCDLASNTCIECTTNGDCTGDLLCDPDTRICVHCLSDADCDSDDVCDLETKDCLDCINDTQCTGGQVCHVETSTCVDCNTDSDCPTGMGCAPSQHQCVDCTQDSHCDAGEICNVDNHTCVECTSTANCSGSLMCDLTSFTCVACAANTDCDDGEICNNQTQECEPEGLCSNPACTGPEDDLDQDGIINSADSCPESDLFGWISTAASDRDGDGCRDAAEDLDDDNDQVADGDDGCPSGELGWISGSATDHDSDGCRDSSEDDDDDNDGVPDATDLCATGELSWSSDATSDHDSDGCRDSSEDGDDDNDGMADGSDACSTGDLGWQSGPATDLDNDGCRDAGEDLDDDGDTVADAEDSNPTNPYACQDSDDDLCDDCSVTGGPPDPSNDGLDTAPADGQCDSNWTMSDWPSRKSITVSAGRVSTDLTFFPLLVSLTDTDLAADAQDDGDDILFTNQLGSKIAYQIERFDGNSGELVAWVNVPLLASASDTVLYMYFGNASSAAQANPAGVWDSSYLGVWHLNEQVVNEARVKGAHLDSTVNGNHADQGGSNEDEGKIAMCQDFGTVIGENDFVEIAPLSASEAPSITLSCWFKSEAVGSIGSDYVAQRCVTQRRLIDQSRFAVGINNDKLAAYWHDGTGNVVEGTTNLEKGVWYHAAVTYDGSTIGLYLNGQQQASQSAGILSAPFDSTGTPDRGGFVIAGGPVQTDRTLDGDIDEVRISDMPRSAAWLRASYLNQNAPSSFYTVGARENL